MHSITDVIEHFKQSWTEELSETAIAQACREADMSWRETTLNPLMTIQIFFVQILHGNTAIEHLPHLTGLSFTAAAYCRAGIRVLKCKTVDGVLRELQVFALIYNMVRQVMLEAARRQEVDVRRISFIDAMRWLQTASPGDELTKLVVNPYRPNRLEPRVKKRRPKQYSLMTKPRRQLKKELGS